MTLVLDLDCEMTEAEQFLIIRFIIALLSCPSMEPDRAEYDKLRADPRIEAQFQRQCLAFKPGPHSP